MFNKNGHTQVPLLDRSAPFMNDIASKRYMCVGIKSCNAGVLGDCGRFPLHIETAKRCVKYWIKILKMPNTRLIKKVPQHDELGNSNRYSRVKQLLQSIGFINVWEMQDIKNGSSFISAFVQRL